MKPLFFILCVLAGCGAVQPENDTATRRPAQVVSAGGRVRGGGVVADVQLGGSFTKP
jgi:hypothetical protein